MNVETKPLEPDTKTASSAEPAIAFQKRAYFPTLIFQFDLPKPKALNDRLLAQIYAERDRDRAGISRSNIPALGGWHSHNDLHRDKDYADIAGKIEDCCSIMSQDQGYDPKLALRIGTMWSIINPPGASNRAHVHPGCLWSGVYYIQAPEGAGNIEFIEPRTPHLMNQPKFKPNQKRAKENWTKVRFTPTAGRMFIFPSWLYHGVDTNIAEAKGDAGNRIIISFNLNQVKA